MSSVTLKLFLFSLLLVQHGQGLDDLDWDISMDDGVLIAKRHTYEDFKRKHVILSNEVPFNAGDEFWKNLAKDRLGSKYGTKERNTFMTVQNLNDLLNGFTPITRCPFSNNDSTDDRRSNIEFDVTELVKIPGVPDYQVRNHGNRFVCVRFENNKPVHFVGFEE